MPLDRKALMQKLMASFQEEAAERLAVLESELLHWQEAPPGQASLDTVFREVHSLKGAARAVGLPEPEQLCHAWEAQLLLLRTGKLAYAPPMLPVFQVALQLLKRYHAGEQPTAEQVRQASTSLVRLEQAGQGMTPPSAPAVAAPVPPPVREASEPAKTAGHAESPAVWRGQTVRVRAEQCEQLAYYAEAMRQSRMQAQDLHRRGKGLTGDFQRIWQRRLRQEGLVQRLRSRLAEGLPVDPASVLQLLDWHEWNLDLLAQMQADATALKLAAAGHDRENASLSDAYSRTVDELLQLPCRSMLDEMPAMVAELALQTGKQAELHLPATNLQVDKRVLDALRTPLMHLLRNAIDHGIEAPAERVARGKPPQGRLDIALQQESGSHFTLTLHDDGTGIDIARLRQKAVELGLMAGEAEVADERLLPLVFQSGLSTSPMLTTLSGRGEGLAIVREALEQLGGSISVQSSAGKGCRFILQLPLSRSSFGTVLVRIAEYLFAVPANAISTLLRMPREAIRYNEHGRTVVVNGTLMPVYALSDILELPAGPDETACLHLLVLGEQPQQIAIQVDEVVGDQDITLKPLGKQLQRVRNLMGATVLGDGTLVPVLHPQDLYRSCLQWQGTAVAAPVPEKTRQARILVADDSFTSRGLLRALLETAGYHVQTACDGLEAWNALRQGEFDLLVSDIEMPRMDGFSLTARLRADKTLSELPVVLVTALHSDEDRARGLEVGANAYLVKGGLETDTVLAAVKRLL